MMLIVASLALADPVGPTANGLYESEVARATDAVKAALPRLAACKLPAADRVMLKVALASGKVEAAVQQGGSAAPLASPCVERAVRDVFAQAAPRVGTEAALLLRVSGGLALEGDVALFGTLGTEAVEEGVRAHIDRIAKCYTDAVVNGTQEGGKLDVSFTVLPDGAVAEPTVKRSTLNDPAIATCVLGEVRALHFAPPDSGGVVRVTYPFTFRPQPAQP